MAEQEWRDACLFMTKGPSSTLEFLQDDPKSLLWAYWMQSLQGPYHSHNQGTVISTDEWLRKKMEAWQGLGDMPKSQARKLFVEMLSQLLPEWRKWSNEHAERIRKETERGTENILKAFFLKTGIAQSRL